MWLINVSLVSFRYLIWKVLFSGNTHFIHSLLEYKNGYCACYKDFIVYCALDKISVNLDNFKNLDYASRNIYCQTGE